MPFKIEKISQEITDKYSIENNALVRIAKDDPKDRIQVEVGDTKVPEDFLPQLKLMRWDNEVNFSVRLIENETGNAKVTFDKDKVKWSKGNIDVEYCEYGDDDRGGYKMVWYLKKKPTTNKIEFSIQSKELKFSYQPPLTKEFQNGYSEKFQTEIVVSEIQVKDLEGNVLVNRPENVVGSYAVYHNGNPINYIDGKLYYTGKFAHIYRPKLIDSNGWEEWGILHIEDGIYSVEIPEDFYNNAVYPIRNNDDFGYRNGDVPGGTQTYEAGSDIRGANFTAPADYESFVSLTWYGSAYSGTINIKGIVVLESTYLIVTNGVGDIEAISDTAGWKDVPYTSVPSISASTDYWLAYIGDNFSYYYWDTDVGVGRQDPSNSYTTPTDPIVGGTETNEKISIYATYTPAGPAGPANVKSVNGVAVGSIKSINSVLIASVKSVNGIT